LTSLSSVTSFLERNDWEFCSVNIIKLDDRNKYVTNISEFIQGIGDVSIDNDKLAIIFSNLASFVLALGLVEDNASGEIVLFCNKCI